MSVCHKPIYRSNRTLFWLRVFFYRSEPIPSFIFWGSLSMGVGSWITWSKKPGFSHTSHVFFENFRTIILKDLRSLSYVKFYADSEYARIEVDIMVGWGDIGICRGNLSIFGVCQAKSWIMRHTQVRCQFISEFYGHFISFWIFLIRCLDHVIWSIKDQ